MLCTVKVVPCTKLQVKPGLQPHGIPYSHTKLSQPSISETIYLPALITVSQSEGCLSPQPLVLLCCVSSQNVDLTVTLDFYIFGITLSVLTRFEQHIMKGIIIECKVEGIAGGGHLAKPTCSSRDTLEQPAQCTSTKTHYSQQKHFHSTSVDTGAGSQELDIKIKHLFENSESHLVPLLFFFLLSKTKQSLPPKHKTKHPES